MQTEIPNLIKRVENFGQQITNMGFNTAESERELNQEQNSKIDFESKVYLEVMLYKLVNLSSNCLQLHEFEGKRKEKELKKVEWYESLYELNQFYNFKEFVN